MVISHDAAIQRREGATEKITTVPAQTLYHSTRFDVFDRVRHEQSYIHAVPVVELEK